MHAKKLFIKYSVQLRCSWLAVVLFLLCVFSVYIYIYLHLTHSPWYNRTGWLGVKHQVTYSRIHPVSVLHAHFSQSSHQLYRSSVTFHREQVERWLTIIQSKRTLAYDTHASDIMQLLFFELFGKRNRNEVGILDSEECWTVQWSCGHASGRPLSFYALSAFVQS